MWWEKDPDEKFYHQTVSFNFSTFLAEADFCNIEIIPRPVLKDVDTKWRQTVLVLEFRRGQAANWDKGDQGERKRATEEKNSPLVIKQTKKYGKETPL